jgi:hypothetical protein
MSNNKVSIHTIIGNVIGNLGIRNVNNVIDDFARWAVDAEMKIGSEGAYRRFECELDIKERRACLPDNFITLIAVKKGDNILDMSTQSFKLMNKGAETGVADSNSNFVSGNYQPFDPGAPNVLSTEFFGTYIGGEIINLTVAANRNGTISVNTFSYVVVGGETLNDIALAFEAQFMAVSNLGYSVVASGSVLNLTANDNLTTLQITPFTDSLGGTIEVKVLQNRRLPSSCNVEQGDNNTIRFQSNNLSELQLNNLNTGSSASGDNGVNFWGRAGAFTSFASKFTMENGYLYFNQLDDTKVGIAYWGVDLDEEGWPLINELHEDAVTHYLMYMYKARDYYAGKLPQNVYKEMQARWFWLCGQARGDDEMPGETELRQLSNMWAQILPLRNKNFF